MTCEATLKQLYCSQTLKQETAFGGAALEAEAAELGSLRSQLERCFITWKSIPRAVFSQLLN